MITYDVDVYIGRNDPVKAATVKCHDTGINLRVFLKTEKKTSQWGSEAKAYAIPAGVTPVLKITKPDKKCVLQDGTPQGAAAFFALPPQSFTVAGTASAEINLFGADGRRLTSDTFFIEVPKEVADDCAEDSETYVSVMAQQILAAQEAADRAEAAAVNPPKLSEKNTWLVWDPQTGKYTDTGVNAEGGGGSGGGISEIKIIEVESNG